MPYLSYTVTAHNTGPGSAHPRSLKPAYEPDTGTLQSASPSNRPLADHKRWKQLTRWTHCRENLPATYRAIAGLVSDRNTTD